MKRHILYAIVENKAGVLARVATLFSARGFNIDSLAVGETEDARFSRMTIVLSGDDAVLEQVRKQLDRLINVVKVQDFSDTPVVERDLLLIRVNVPPEKRGEILELVQVFRAKVVDVGQSEMIIEMAASEDKIESFIALLRPYGILEMARTGRVALPRSQRS
jgi:acetolactate synthase-1/3 small subunit